MKKTAALLFVLGAVAFVVWMAAFRAPTPAGPSPAPAPATQAFVTSAPAPAAEPELSAEARALLAALDRALATLGVREREGVLTFKDDAALQAFLSRAAKSGLTVLGHLPALRAVRVRWDSPAGLARDLAAHAGDYAGVEANPLFGLPRPPSREERAAVNQVPFGNETLAFLGATGDRAAWGRGTTIAILDTGIAGDATFGAGRVQALDLGLGLAPGRGDDDGHGTAIAALAAGRLPEAGGVAPGANLLSVRVTDAIGVSDLFTIAQGIVAAVDAGARLVNISLGGYSTGAVLDAAIGYATERGALIIAAAGNDQAAQLAWPAADPRVVSVGAIDRAEQQVSFSNSGAQLSLTAPGYGVQTAWLDGRRVTIDGTSASAPLVAGAIAAVMTQNPALTPRQAADLLARTANDAGAPGPDAAFGHGIVNLATALNATNPAYIDTAVSSHHFDAASGQLQIVVQNRSGRTVSGLSLSVAAGNAPANNSTVPPLAPGETHVVRTPVDATALRNAGSITFATRLTTPAGLVDQVPANNSRTSVLTAPTPKP